MKLIDLLNEDNSDKLGDCFIAAGRNILDSKIPGLTLVHAMVTGQGKLAKKRFPHAWNEIGDVVIDNSNGRNIMMRKEQYYKLGHIKQTPGEYATYSSDAALKKMVKTRNWGPWDLND